ncbi:hypothetical protein EM595_3396 [Duffyella gerundensis]|uniref:Uncharacterized protein n=1 Tax=Duffyella gerundensis TaxID=1619313 RepID=A0A0U5L908_9GAMM|nr:hypothetical protein EM595_3396 [Duffyella gerundensis]
MNKPVALPPVFLWLQRAQCRFTAVIYRLLSWRLIKTAG